MYLENDTFNNKHIIIFTYSPDYLFLSAGEPKALGFRSLALVRNMKRNFHLFHLVARSPWPILVAISVFFFVSGLAFFMHSVKYGGYFMI